MTKLDRKADKLAGERTVALESAWHFAAGFCGALVGMLVAGVRGYSHNTTLMVGVCAGLGSVVSYSRSARRTKR